VNARVLAAQARHRNLASRSRRGWRVPAATATGLPDSVPAWYTGPSGAIFSMIARLPPNAPTGMPTANDFAERGQVGP